MPDVVETLCREYADFLGTPTEGLLRLYSDDVVFRDPVHEVRGKTELMAYFDGVSTNLQACRFEFDDIVREGDRAMLIWQMHYRHARLAGGRDLSLRGNTYLLLDPSGDTVRFHEDFYDLGAMVYEHLPVLGWALRSVKSRLQGPATPAPSPVTA